MDNIKEERKEIRSFIKKFDRSLLDSLFYADKPDAMLIIDEKKIGLEHTRIYQPKLDKRNNVQHQEVLLDDIVTNSKHNFNKKYNLPDIDVLLIFETNYWINVHQERFSNKEVERLSEDISMFVYENLPSKGDTFECEIPDFDKLPKGVTSITIHHSISENVAEWRRAKGGFIPFIHKNYIQEMLNNKNEKLRDYQNSFEEYWLLLVGTNFKYERNTKIYEEDLEKTYQTAFDRVFLFFINVSGNIIHELKKSI